MDDNVGGAPREGATKPPQKPTQPNNNGVTLADAREFQRMLDEGLTQARVAELAGMKQGTVCRHLKVLELPHEVHEWIEKRGLTMFAAYELVRLFRKKPSTLKDYICVSGEGLAFYNSKPLNGTGVRYKVSELLNPPKPREVRVPKPSPYAPIPEANAARLAFDTALEQAAEELITAYTSRLIPPSGMNAPAIELLCRGYGLEKDFTFARAMEQSIRIIAKSSVKGASRVDPLRVFDLVWNASGDKHQATADGNKWLRLAGGTVRICGECGEVKSMTSIYCCIPRKDDGEPDTPLYRCGEHLKVDQLFAEKPVTPAQTIKPPPGHEVMYGRGGSNVYHFAKKDGERARCTLEKEYMLYTPKAGMRYTACPICNMNAALTGLAAKAAVRHG